MFIHYFLTATLAFGLLVCPCPSFSSGTDNRSGSDLEGVIKKIQAREKSLQTFVAKFVQVKQSRLLREPLHSEGLIYFDRAGKMLWRTTKPSPFAALIINDSLYLYYPDIEKTQKRNVRRSTRLLKKYFGLGQSTEELKKLYKIDLSNGKNPNSVSLTLFPKRKATSTRIETIEVIIDTKSWLPTQVHFKEAKGDFTSLTLFFTSTNADLPKGTFSLPSAAQEANSFQISNGKGGGP